LERIHVVAIDEPAPQLRRRCALGVADDGVVVFLVLAVAFGVEGFVAPGLQQRLPGTPVILPPCRVEVQAIQTGVTHDNTRCWAARFSPSTYLTHRTAPCKSASTTKKEKKWKRTAREGRGQPGQEGKRMSTTW